MEKKDISVVITTFNSEEIIHSCLSSLPKDVQAFVVENSNNEKFKDLIKAKYSNVECILTGGNKGYSVANNIGLKKVKTQYALVLNPDAKVEENALENFLISAKNNPEFWLMGPGNHQSKETDYKNNTLIEVENLKGFAIFFNLKKFNNNFFDENYFLYFEEIDLCKKVIKNKGKIILDNNIKISHLGGSSVNLKFKEQLEKNRNWHWMWSTFYFHKKYRGLILATIIIFPKLFSSFLKVIYYQLIFNKKMRDIYFCRLSGIINSVFGKRSWYRPTFD
jgi:GT2 family glycosyltransferase